MLNVTRGSQHIVHIDNGASLKKSGRHEGQEQENLIRKHESRQVVALGGGVHWRGLRKLGGLLPDLGDGCMAYTDVKIHLTVPVSSVQSLSRVQLSATPRIAACQASLSITNSQSVPKHVHAFLLFKPRSLWYFIMAAIANLIHTHSLSPRLFRERKNLQSYHFNCRLDHLWPYIFLQFHWT